MTKATRQAHTDRMAELHTKAQGMSIGCDDHDECQRGPCKVNEAARKYAELIRAINNERDKCDLCGLPLHGSGAALLEALEEIADSEPRHGEAVLREIAHAALARYAADYGVEAQ